jgi:BASS family bile acid:Na+ symporter
MNADGFLARIAQLSGLLFVVTSRLAIGMSPTAAQIVQPPKNAHRLFLARRVNPIVAPLLAFILTRILPLEPSLQAGLIVPAPGAARK